MSGLGEGEDVEEGKKAEMWEERERRRDHRGKNLSIGENDGAQKPTIFTKP